MEEIELKCRQSGSKGHTHNHHAKPPHTIRYSKYVVVWQGLGEDETNSKFIVGNLNGMTGL